MRSRVVFWVACQDWGDLVVSDLPVPWKCLGRSPFVAGLGFQAVRRVHRTSMYIYIYMILYNEYITSLVNIYIYMYMY